MKSIIAVVLMLLSGSAFATTWGRETVKDPINGKDCEVQSPMSSGSYIYQWSSKYDGVYWPFIDTNWIWHCKESGYTSFGNDFDSLSLDEVKSISQFLEQHHVAGTTSQDYRLWLLESIYRLRNTEPGFWAWFLRVKANLYDDMASAARFEAIPLLEKEVTDLPPSFDLVQKLFVLGDYYRRIGEDQKARAMFTKSKDVEWLDKDGKPQQGSAYINELIAERLLMMDKK